MNTFQANDNYLDYANAGNALQVTTNAQGVPVCISGGRCVPWNIFQTGGVTQAALNYLDTPGTASGVNTEQVEHVDITGDLGKYGLKSPIANDGAGGELRLRAPHGHRDLQSRRRGALGRPRRLFRRDRPDR